MSLDKLYNDMLGRIWSNADVHIKAYSSALLHFMVSISPC